MPDEPERLDQPEILDEVITPAQPVDRPGSPHVRGIGEGIAIAVVLVLILGGMGFVAFGRPGSSPAPSASPVSAIGTATPSSPAPTPSPTDRPTPGPVVTPATACAATTPATPPVPKIHVPGFRWYGTLLSDAWLADPAVATAIPESIADAAIPPADPLVVSLDNRWCALAWQFELDGMPIASQDNPAMNPGYASQNAWSIRLPATADPAPELRARLAFPQGWAVILWRIHFSPQPVPDAFLASGDASVATAPGCGIALTLKNGARSTERCASTLPVGEPGHLQVVPDAELAFRVPGAGFEPATGAQPGPDAPVLCGTVAGNPADFDVHADCALDVGFDPSNALTFSAPSDAGTWWLAIQGCTTVDGNRACGRWYGIVDVVAPEGTPQPG